MIGSLMKTAELMAAGTLTYLGYPDVIPDADGVSMMLVRSSCWKNLENGGENLSKGGDLLEAIKRQTQGVLPEGIEDIIGGRFRALDTTESDSPVPSSAVKHKKSVFSSSGDSGIDLSTEEQQKAKNERLVHLVNSYSTTDTVQVDIAEFSEFDLSSLTPGALISSEDAKTITKNEFPLIGSYLIESLEGPILTNNRHLTDNRRPDAGDGNSIGSSTKGGAATPGSVSKQGLPVFVSEELQQREKLAEYINLDDANLKPIKVDRSGSPLVESPVVSRNRNLAQDHSDSRPPGSEKNGKKNSVLSNNRSSTMRGTVTLQPSCLINPEEFNGLWRAVPITDLPIGMRKILNRAKVSREVSVPLQTTIPIPNNLWGDKVKALPQELFYDIRTGQKMAVAEIQPGTWKTGIRNLMERRVVELNELTRLLIIVVLTLGGLINAGARRREEEARLDG